MIYFILADSKLSPVLRFGQNKIMSNERCQGYFPHNVVDTTICLSGENGVSTCRVCSISLNIILM